MSRNHPKKRMSREERRRQILEAALSVFVKHGFKGTTTQEIAKAAQVSEVTLFRYFASKQEIFMEGIRPILLSTLETTLHLTADLSPQEKLEYVLLERIRLISENHRIVKLILSEPPLISSLGNECPMEGILRILQEMLAQIGISLADEAYVLRLLMGSILSFLYMPQPDEGHMRRYARQIAAHILGHTEECAGKEA